MIAVVGEALIDLVHAPGRPAEARCGGANFNLARTVALLGEPVRLVGRISRDAYGMRLREALAGYGVDPAGIVDTDDPTTLALAEVDGRGVATYTFSFAGTSAPGLEPAEARDALPAGLSVLHVGALGLALRPLADAAEHVVLTAPPEVLVSVDPNLRPQVAGDQAFRARLERVLARADLVKVSADDLALLEPEASTPDAARRMLERGARAVLLTRGGAGATAITPSGAADVAAPAVTVVDTIGAGDAFGGAFLAWWRHRELGAAQLGDLDALTRATAFACRVASAVVADPFHPETAVGGLRGAMMD
ncbi:MAG: carbohydrate kinase [Thermoleophilia bacterium]|nr:carbohydrate kinase [Thermoleophilia bacterium]